MRAALSAHEFAALMAPLGPFEQSPVLAVAVSGGADSMALALLADGWARGRGGRIAALTVDHGLRPESAAEAARVGAWMALRGIDHHVLPWTGAKPASDIQAAARAARYRLLEEWCRERGVLHLLLGHHRRDQAETVLLRLGRGSGVDGLAGMAAVAETAHLRLVRPLLAVPPGRLAATLAQAGQDWVEDPSNADPAYARARLRRLGPVLAAEGLSEDRLAATAGRMGRARAALESMVARAAARHASIHPAGFVLAAAEAFPTLEDEVGLRLLSRVLSAVGGGSYPPRLDRLEALHAVLAAGGGAGRTLAGCRVAHHAGSVLFCREPARVAPPVALEPGAEGSWDGRFRFKVADGAPAGLVLGALGTGWRPPRPMAIPSCARPGLPAIRGDGAICAVPHLGYNRDDVLEWIEPAPSIPLTVGRRCLV